MQSLRSATVVLVALFTFPLLAQSRPDPKVLMDAQRDAMKVISWMDGVWRGPADTDMGGGKHHVTQTERIGPMLGGSIKVMEGRGYNADGSVGFNAFAILSYEPATKSYTLHSHAMGQKGDFALTPTADGYVWEIPLGPMTIRYTATVKDGKWREVGDRIVAGKDPVRFFEMNLVRVSDSTWPDAGAVAPK